MATSIDPKLSELVSRSFDSTKISSIKPDPKLLEETLSMAPHNVPLMSDQELSERIFGLSQYQVYIQAQTNARNVKFINIKRRYEMALNQAASKIDPKVKTVKEREALALAGSDDLRKMLDDLTIAESDYLLFENIPQSMIELCNALKKEMALRTMIKR